ncbi:hypothetical protein J1605_008723 [Eschrichtius robustus]|uniref:Uncharacterized protein n=1 Tax=Eschrichtius robustus TaxID=9764 RepID=A0AB34GYF3_ESCRO|nr:hypothetical protein J1605_008723 [Eschrichtius robustus]
MFDTSLGDSSTSGVISHQEAKFRDCSYTLKSMNAAKLTFPLSRALEPMLCNKRSHRNEKPAHHNEE